MTMRLFIPSHAARLASELRSVLREDGGFKHIPQGATVKDAADQLEEACKRIAELRDELARSRTDRDTAVEALESVQALCDEYHAAKEPLERVFDAAYAVLNVKTAAAKGEAMAELDRAVEAAKR